MLNTTNSRNFRDLFAPDLGAEKATNKATQKSVVVAVAPEYSEFAVISNLGRMPRPWIIWDLIGRKSDTR